MDDTLSKQELSSKEDFASDAARKLLTRILATLISIGNMHRESHSNYITSICFHYSSDRNKM